MQTGCAMKTFLDAKNSQVIMCAAEASRTQPAIQSAKANRMRGPFTVEMAGRFDSPRGTGLGTRYIIRVRGRSDTLGRVVCQRYSRFEVVRLAMISRFPNLPPLPPRSEFRRRFSPKFRQHRQAGLEGFLQQAITADPFADTPALRKFLSADDLLQPTFTNPCPSLRMQVNVPCRESSASTALTLTPSSSDRPLVLIQEADDHEVDFVGNVRSYGPDATPQFTSAQVSPNWVQIELDYMGLCKWHMD